MEINTRDIAVRRMAWEAAVEMTGPIFDEHSLEDYKVGTGVFITPSTVTKTEQQIDHILRVADWLLDIN